MSHLLMANSYYAQSGQHDVNIVLFPAPICPVSAIATRQMKHTPAERSYQSLGEFLSNWLRCFFDVSTYHAKSRVSFGCDFFNVFRPPQI